MKPGCEDTEVLGCKGAPSYGSVKDVETGGTDTTRSTKLGDLRERTIGHPVVDDIDQIPEVCRGKYTTKDGAVIVPVVGVAVKVISISDLNMAENTFKADFNVNVAWKGGSTDGPEIQFYNIVEEIEREQVPKTVEEEQKDGEDPKILCKGKKGSNDGVNQWDFFYRVRIRGVFRQQYKLADFPFDTQHLLVDIRMKSRCKLIPLRWGYSGEAASCDPRAVNEEFTLIAADVGYKYLPSYKFGALDGYDPETTITFEVRRKPMFWVVSYGLVASLVCSLMACTYAIPIENIGERLGVAMTLVLTMTATKYLMQEKLPAVSYFTLLDIHIVLCCIFLMALTFEIGFTGIVGRQKLDALEKEFLPWLGVLWIAYHIIFAAWIAWHERS